MINRRTAISASLATLATSAVRAESLAAGVARFPAGFLWGAATAGHQVEGNNVNADQWLLETVKPSLAAAPSGDACNSFELWRTDLDLVKSLGLNSYRFSIEWPRIEPEDGQFSLAMLDHYKAMIEGCHVRGLSPVVTLSHFTTPRWFAARGGWLNPDAPALFARYCDRAIRHLGDGLRYVATLNEPNNALLLQSVLPAPFWAALRASLQACAKASGTERFTVGNTVLPEDVASITQGLLAAHKLGRDAIKALRPSLRVGVTLAVLDDQAVGVDSVRDARRETFYGPWLRAARNDDYVGVQNYERAVWDGHGKLPSPSGTPRTYGGAEIYPASLANAVRYVHAQTNLPILVTEHGLGTTDDRLRANLIPAALTHLRAAIADGIPVEGYIHWSLLDNYEWGGSDKARFGLVAVDRATFRRTPKPSASVLTRIVARESR
ncbi:family 1 glycosylhydrolase [Sphingomonas sp. RB3P16]|uniref:glycoside hydrolase family 1 protein n=1 Tax=Parasphingomonas frigoris TaxID=3096163 RepID=UPI002FCCA7FE